MQANKFQLCLAACAASLSASQTPAQETIYGATGGDFLFGFSGSYRYAHASSPVIGPGADEVESFVARGNLSWFGSREHELGFELAPGFVADESSGTSFDLYAGGYYNYNWWTSPQMAIYAGPQVGLLNTDPSVGSGETAFSWGAHAGLRFWIDPRVSIDIEPRVSFTSLDESLGGDETIFDLLFGLSVKL